MRTAMMMVIEILKPMTIMLIMLKNRSETNTDANILMDSEHDDGDDDNKSINLKNHDDDNDGNQCDKYIDAADDMNMDYKHEK